MAGCRCSVAVGIALYFALPREPSVLTALVPLVTMVAWRAAGGARATLTTLLIAALLAAALGLALAKLRVEWVRAPVLTKQLNAAEVRGYIELIEQRPRRGQRLTLRVTSLGDLPEATRPARVRVTTNRALSRLQPGSAVRLRATLMPPSEPALPGDYDFGRQAWFAGIGAVGYSLSAPTIEAGAPEAPTDLRLWAAVQRVRQAIGARIAAALPGETGAIATALITGERGGISDATTDAFRDSGILHILSISGFHMAIMAGSVFFLVRLALAAFPSIALVYPIKKWAAAAAMLAAFAYLLISGAAFATVRSTIMIAIMSWPCCSTGRRSPCAMLSWRRRSSFSPFPRACSTSACRCRSPQCCPRHRLRGVARRRFLRGAPARHARTLHRGGRQHPHRDGHCRARCAAMVDAGTSEANGGG